MHWLWSAQQGWHFFFNEILTFLTSPRLADQAHSSVPRQASLHSGRDVIRSLAHPTPFFLSLLLLFLIKVENGLCLFVILGDGYCCRDMLPALGE